MFSAKVFDIRRELGTINPDSQHSLGNVHHYYSKIMVLDHVDMLRRRSVAGMVNF